jgi:hypothetical protein
MCMYVFSDGCMRVFIRRMNVCGYAVMWVGNNKCLSMYVCTYNTYYVYCGMYVCTVCTAMMMGNISMYGRGNVTHWVIATCRFLYRMCGIRLKYISICDVWWGLPHWYVPFTDLQYILLFANKCARAALAACTCVCDTNNAVFSVYLCMYGIAIYNVFLCVCIILMWDGPWAILYGGICAARIMYVGCLRYVTILCLLNSLMYGMRVCT